jgi:hypothetical protein
MNFSNPLMFLWLGAAVPVVALYFLKLKRKRVPVSSTWLWVRSIQDLRVNAPFQRLRKSLLLLLQLLLIAAGAFALAEPSGRRAPPEEKRWVFLIDRSASMRMADLKPSRLEAAKGQALEVLKACGPRDEVMVVSFSNRAQVMTPLTASRQAIERAIAEIRPADTSTRIQEAFRIAVSAVQPYKSREIVIFSDGRFEQIQGAAEGVDLRYVPVGATPKNAAIAAIEVRRPARTDEPWTIYAQLDLFHDKELEVPVELYVNSQLRAVKKVPMPANSSHAVLFEITKPEPTVVEAKLALEDDLAADNRAWAVVKPDRAKILLASTENFFLDQAMAHAKEMEAYRTEDLSKASLGEYEIIVLDRVMPEVLPEGRYLILGAVPKWDGVKVVGEAAQPPLVDWERRHPVTRMVNLANLYIKSSPRVELSAFGITIAESTDSPLIFSYERGRTRAVVVAFDILQSDWPLRLSFPLFIANALDWLREDQKAQPRPGEPLRIRLAEGEAEVEVTGPRGQKETLRGEPGRDAVFGETDGVGLYSYVVKDKAGTRSRTHAVALNLADPLESSGQVAKELKTSTGRTALATVSPPALSPYWRWFALALLILLLVEWTVYHRRLEI